MKSKLKNKVFYIHDGTTIKEVKDLIIKHGMKFDFYKFHSNGWKGIRYNSETNNFESVNLRFNKSNASFNDFKRIMRPTWKKWLEWIGIGLIIVLSAIILFSCGNVKPNQRKAVKLYEKSQNQLNKAKARGLIVNERQKVPDAYDIGTDSLGKPYLRPLFFDCPPYYQLEFPKSNVQIRQEEKTKRNQDNNDRKENNSDNKFNWKMYSDSLEAVIKLERQETKQLQDSLKAKKAFNRIENRKMKHESNCWNWWDKLKFGVMVGVPCFVLGFLIRWIIKLFKKIKFGLFSWYGNSH